MLTSGTTGAPKGASRAEPKSLIQLGGLLARVPFRQGQSLALGPPMFHTLGLAILVFGSSLGMTVRMRRRFRPDSFADDLQAADCAVAVPVMMHRVLALDDLERRDFSRLKIMFMGGSMLGAQLYHELTATLGPIVYNLYGSTEVTLASIATPSMLAIAPDSVGSPPLGTQVCIFDQGGVEMVAGTTGRIFVNTGIPFDGYTSGGSKEIIDGLIASGDVGHFDSHGFLAH